MTPGWRGRLTGLPGIAAVSALLILATLTGALLTAPAARADGDPGSDELLAQNLFTGSLTLSARQQLQLGSLLDATAKAGAPVRVAIISSRSDLGTVTKLWDQPQTYAEYLGYEISLDYRGLLLVVMPDGYGVIYCSSEGGQPHDTVPSSLRSLSAVPPPLAGTPSVYLSDTVGVVERIETAAGIDRSVLAHDASGLASPRPAGGASEASSAGKVDRPSKASPHKLPAGVLLAVIVGLLLLYVGWRSGRLRRLRPRGPSATGRVHIRPLALFPTALLALVVAALALNQIDSSSTAAPSAQKIALATNPLIDPGTVLQPARAAPGFTLTDQTGRSVSLRQYHGKVVILAFVDAECQTICPLTTTAMLDAQAALGRHADQVQLLGVNANWRSTQIDDVLNYTDLHGMSGRWNFLTGTVGELTRVWKDYRINEKAFSSNEINHVAAVFLIDPAGRLRASFTTYPSYASVPQVGQLLAQDASKLLPDHPPVETRYSYAEAPQISPARSTSIPRLGGGKLALGPGKAHLYLFFATWDRQTTPIAADLESLNAYAATASAQGLPSITAVDESSVEPSAQALKGFVRDLPEKLRYPIGLDTSGAIADGYQVEGEPWFVLTNAAGKIVWYQEVYTEGWPKLAQLEREVRTSLAGTSDDAPSVQQARSQLAGSPAPLAALHDQASKLLPGGQSALDARIAALRRAGYPVVLNIWASWCGPCQAEFGVFAKASEQYGKKVAFIGADVDDSASDAQAFLNQHHVSYPSYPTTSGSIDRILVGGLQATPTTVFISPTGEITNEHPDNYTSVGALDADVQAYSLTAQR